VRTLWQYLTEQDPKKLAAIAAAQAPGYVPTAAPAWQEVKTVKLAMRTMGGRHALEKLLRDGWVIANRRDKGLLEWGYKTTFTLTRNS
jgi:hypothetical protein